MVSPESSSRQRFDDVSGDALRKLIGDAVRASVPAHECLSDEELAAVRSLIQSMARRAKFREAVIEKSLIGLIGAAVVWLGVIVREYAISHGLWRA